MRIEIGNCVLAFELWLDSWIVTWWKMKVCHFKSWSWYTKGNRRFLVRKVGDTTLKMARKLFSLPIGILFKQKSRYRKQDRIMKKRIKRRNYLKKYKYEFVSFFFHLDRNNDLRFLSPIMSASMTCLYCSNFVYKNISIRNKFWLPFFVFLPKFRKFCKNAWLWNLNKTES